MKKRILCIALVLSFCFSMCNIYGADITYNNRVIRYADQEPVILNDRTYVPIRDVFEALGFAVDWDAATKRVKLKNTDYAVDVNMTTNILSVYEVAKQETRSFELVDKPILVSGRTMLPLREILEAVGYSVEWSSESKNIVIAKAEIVEHQTETVEATTMN